MNLERFLNEREPAWEELAQLVAKAKKRPERLGPDGVRRLGAAYRAAAADLALARRSFPGDPVVQRLEQLVARARHLVYAAPAKRVSLAYFVRRGYWRLVAERPYVLLAATALLFAPAALAGAWALDDPGAAGGLVPPEFRSVTETEQPWEDLPAGEQAAFSSYVLTNNIRVTALAFAGGIAVGLLTAFVLVANGMILGAVAGLMIEQGNWQAFVHLVVGHGVLELSCIVVAGAAGLRFGWAIVEPGRQTRLASAMREARRSVALVLGTAPWLVVAGVIEGFRAELAEAGLAAGAIVGFGFGALYWLLVFTLGRARAEPEPAL